MMQVVEPPPTADTPTVGFKYFAFLSYSHRDAQIAGRFHHDLEQYRVPKPLVGAQGRDGLIPKRLFPIFRDREELASSPDLSTAIRAALSQSACLVVLCSPEAAQSRWVNEEILAFRRLGRHDRIFPVIVRGEPHAKEPDECCFPPALRVPESLVEGVPVSAEPIAADMRLEGDGKEDSKLKVIAGLLGIPLDDLRRREVIAARKRARIFQGIAAAMLVLAVSAIMGGWMAYRNMQTADRRFDLAMNIAAGVVDRTVAMSDKFGVPTAAIGDLLNWADESFGTLSREELPDALDYQRANMLMVFSDHYAVANRAADQLRVAREARDMLARLVQARPELDEWQQRLSMAYDRLGKAHVARGSLADALAAYREALACDERLLAKSPADRERQRAVAVSRERIGTVLALQGNVREALASQETALSLSKRLADEQPQDLTAQSDLAVSHEKIGELLGRLGRDDDALAQHRAALGLRHRVAQRVPDNTRLQRELEVSYNKVGQMLLARNDAGGALDAHTEALGIARPLAASDPANAEWQHDLAATRLWIGDALERLNRPADALQEYETSLTLTARLVRDNPRNAIYRFGLASSFERLGDIQSRLGRDQDALASYIRKRLILTDLVKEDPTSGEWQRDLVIAHVKVGEALQATGSDARTVLGSYVNALVLVRQMAAAGRLDDADAWMVEELAQRVETWKAQRVDSLR